jgi:hypothetical protein
MTDPTTTPPTCRRSIARRYAAAVPRPLRVAPALLGALAAAALAPGAAPAASKPPTVDKSPRLWATINVCDTVKHPDTIGIRASMPGSGSRHERMFMRFQVQYLDATSNRWTDLGPAADSGFLPVGSAKYRRRESGRNFAISPPPAGQEFALRGVVTFEWRRGDQVVRRARKRTRTGHRGTMGSDPKGFSAAECTIKAVTP